MNIIESNNISLMRDILSHKYNPIVWSHILPMVRSKEMLLLILNYLPIQEKKIALHMISLWDNSNPLSFDESILINRIDSILSISESQLLLYDLSPNAIQMIYNHNLLNRKYRSIYEDNPSSIKSGYMGLNSTLFIYKMDSINIYLSPRIGMYPLSDDNEQRFYTYIYLNGRILRNILDNGYAYEILEAIHRYHQSHPYQCYLLIQSILKIDIPMRYRIDLLSLLMVYGWIDILSEHLSNENIHQIVSLSVSIHPDVYILLDHMNLNGSLYRYYIEDTIEPDKISSSFWKVYLATLCVYGKSNAVFIIRRIIHRHSNELTPQLRDRAIFLIKTYNPILGNIFN